MTNGGLSQQQFESLYTVVSRLNTVNTGLSVKTESALEKAIENMALLKDVTDRLSTVEQENKFLRSEIEQLRERTSPSTEIKVAGIPSSSKVPLLDLTYSILKHLKLDSLSADVLDVWKIQPKNQKRAENSRLCHDQMSTFSYVIKFKSAAVCEFVLKTRRLFGEFNYFDLYPGSESHIVRMYEMLPSYEHNLLVSTKDKLKSLNYKHIWVREGKIFVRKSDNSEKLRIITQNDVLQITEARSD